MGDMGDLYNDLRDERTLYRGNRSAALSLVPALEPIHGIKTSQGDCTMSDAGVGWIAAIIIGGLAGWIASNFMKSDTGIFTNILLGIVGAAVASFLLGLVGIGFGGWIGYLIAGFIGACILIWGARAIRA